MLPQPVWRRGTQHVRPGKVRRLYALHLVFRAFCHVGSWQCAVLRGSFAVARRQLEDHHLPHQLRHHRQLVLLPGNRISEHAHAGWFFFQARKRTQAFDRLQWNAQATASLHAHAQTRTNAGSAPHTQSHPPPPTVGRVGPAAASMPRRAVARRACRRRPRRVTVTYPSQKPETSWRACRRRPRRVTVTTMPYPSQKPETSCRACRRRPRRVTVMTMPYPSQKPETSCRACRRRPRRRSHDIRSDSGGGGGGGGGSSSSRRRARGTGGKAPHRSARVRGDLGLESDSGFTSVLSTGRDCLIRDDGVGSDPMRDWNRVRGLAPRMQTAAQTVCTQSKEPPFPLLRLSGLRPLGLSGGYLSLSESG